MSGRFVVAPFVLPHGGCPPGCPYCPAQRSHPRRRALGAIQVAVRRTLDRNGGPVELAFFGGCWSSLPGETQQQVLDVAERLRCEGLVASLRVSLAPSALLETDLDRLVAAGVRTIELSVGSLEQAVLGAMGTSWDASTVLEGVLRCHRRGLRVIVSVSPGLPLCGEAEHRETADQLLAWRPDGLRILPALALDGTWLGACFLGRRWRPLELAQAVERCREVVECADRVGVPVLRVGLRPERDLWERPSVLAGPVDPSLRSWVEGDRMVARAVDAMVAAFSVGTRTMTLTVHPRTEGFLRGPENRCLQALQRRFRLERLHVVPDPTLPPGKLRAFASVAPERLGTS